MANRKSWRRAVAPSTGQTRAAPTSATLRSQKTAPNAPTCTGIEDGNMATMLTILHSKEVNLRSTDGAEYMGLFAGTERPPKSELHVVLRYARIVRAASSGSSVVTVHDVRKSTARKLLVPVSRIVQISAAARELDTVKSGPGADNRVGSKGGFATDGEISRGGTGTGRQLQRFDDFSELSTPIGTGTGAQTLDEETFGDLATSNGGSGKKWDQFQVNEDKFGVKTSFDEDEYTTKIDRHDVKYAERQREAARLASEIEAKTSDNVHIRQERNQAIGTDYDEETLFSGVHRPSANDSEKRPAPVENTAENYREPRAVPTEKPRLSYAAAAASSMKAAAPASNSTVPNANAPGKATLATKSGSMSKSNSTSKQAMQSKGSGTVKQPPASKQAPSAKQVPASKQPVVSKQATSQKPSTQKQSASFRQQSQPTKNTPTSKPGSIQNSTQGSKPVQSTRQTGANAATPPVTATNGNSVKQATSSPMSLSASTDNKERDILEKKSKIPGPRERSSRENLPQLVKVRTSITGRTSPNQSRNSPLPTPATADTSAVAVLNLDAQTPNLGPEQIKRFEEYKTNREIRSIAENREKITDDLKKFSTQLDSRNGQLRRSHSATGSSTNSNTPSATEKKNIEAVVKTDDKSESAPKTELAAKATPKQIEQKTEENKTAENASSTGGETAQGKTKTKLKSKLNPNAQEFKFNPDAPSFKPSSAQKPASAATAPQNFSPYPVNAVAPEYSQSMQAAHQAYPVPMQAMGQISYGQPPYGMISPGGVPVGVTAPGNPAYQFMQGPPSSFHGSQVPARFAQGAAPPASYPYPHMNPTMPMVMAQPPQRMSAGPYAYYNAGPYGAGQVPGSPQLPQPPQPAVYAPSSQPGLLHLQGGVQMSGRGGHGHPRRAGGGRRGGKHQGQHSHNNLQEAAAVSTDKVAQRPESAAPVDMPQR